MASKEYGVVNISAKSVKTKLIVNFKLQKAGIDFMGYNFNLQEATYHHLIIPKRRGGQATYENGAILMRTTAHDYIHIIERYDLDVFDAITEAIISQKNKGHLDVADLKYIKSCLEYFEKYYSNEISRKGKPIIKERYISGRKF